MTPNSTCESEFSFVFQLTVTDDAVIPVNCTLEIVGETVSTGDVEVVVDVVFVEVVVEVVVVFVVVVEVAELPILPSLKGGLDGEGTSPVGVACVEVAIGSVLVATGGVEVVCGGVDDAAGRVEVVIGGVLVASPRFF